MLSISAVITFGYSLFEMNLEGIRIVLPSFILSIQKILPLTTFTPKTSVDMLQIAAYKGLGAIISSLHRFDTCKDIEMFDSIKSNTLDSNISEIVESIFSSDYESKFDTTSSVQFINHSYCRQC